MSQASSSSKAPVPASSALLALAETAMNAALIHDPCTRRKLGQLDGRVVAVVYQGREAVIAHVLPFEGGLRLRASIEGEADVTISGNLPVFARLTGSRGNAGATVSAAMQIRGDIELGQRFKQILDGIHIDWEGALARHVGGTLAHGASRAAQHFLGWRRELHSTFFRDLGEYAQEETGVAARPDEVNRFVSEVDELRHAVDRLAARWRRLQESSS